jgi:hypothetical protein
MASPSRATTRPKHAAGPRFARAWRRIDWIILLGYLVAAVAVTWRLWADPTRMAPTTGGLPLLPDICLSAWSMRYAATAIAHVRLPALVTTAVNAPQGMNLMWNTTMLLPSVLLAPVTLLAGPQLSLNILTTLGFAGSAAAMFVVLRRWGASTSAAAVGGAFFGFSPALRIAAEDHYMLQFAVLAPLIVDAVLRLASGRGRPVRTGIWLGLLVAAQVFISEELLVDSAIASALMVAVLVASRPSASLHRLRSALAGLGVAAGIFLVICGHALWIQFHGPLSEHGSPWTPSQFGNRLADFVTAPDNVLFHGDWAQFLARTLQFRAEYFAYVGWPLLAAVLAAGVFFWRDLRIRMAAVSFAVLELCSLGGHAITVGGWRVSGDLLPWHWLLYVPVVNQALSNRLSILADGAAAVVLAFAVDRIVGAVRSADGRRRLALAAGAAVAAVLVILPLLPTAVPASSVLPVPSGWSTVMARLHLRAGAPVLVLPLSGVQTMEWQAVTGEAFSVVGGYCVAPNPSGRAEICGTRGMLTPAELHVAVLLSRISLGVPGTRGPSRASMGMAISNWRPAAVVVASGSRSAVARYLIGYFGQPTAVGGSVIGWRLGGGPAG